MLGKLMDHWLRGNRIWIQFENGDAAVEVVAPGTIRFVNPYDYINRKSWAIAGGEIPPTVNLKVQKKDDVLQISTAVLTIRIFDNFKIDVYDSQMMPLCKDYRAPRTPFVRRTASFADATAEGHESNMNEGAHKNEIIKEMLGGEFFYGLGEETGPLNKKGYSYCMWNSDVPRPHVESMKSLYQSIPFFIVLRDADAYGIFFDCSFRSYFDMGKENSRYFYFGSDEGDVDYYFIYGPDIRKVVKGYTELTGTTPLPQKWTLGFQQSRWSYAPESRLMEIAENYRKREIPCDVLYLDIDYMDHFKVFTWDTKEFPRPQKMIQKLNEMGFHVVTILDPGVKKEAGYGIYEEGMKNGYFATDPDGATYVNRVWPGDAVFPDFTRQEVRKWWGDNHKVLLDDGVAGIWNDMNEPASFNGPLPDEVMFGGKEHPMRHTEVHNIFGMLMSSASFEGIKRLTGKRPFVITRACYAGVQKYSTVWTGDNQSLWEHLRMSLPMLLNLGISGNSFCGVDVGGFNYDSTEELFVRWMEAACFSPLYRDHSCTGTRDQEPWAFGAQAEKICKKYIGLRYKMIPYLYDLLAEGEKTGLPVLRPLVMEFQSDPHTRQINDQYLVGDMLMVAPVVEQGAEARAVYLPEGRWVDYWTKESLEGGRYIVREAELDTCPIYVREGAVLPAYPVMNYTSERKVDELTLDIYPGKGHYCHYQDDGEGYAYRDGVFNLFEITTDVSDSVEIEISRRHAEYPDGYNTIRLTVNGFSAAAAFVDGAPSEFETKNGAAILTVKAGDASIKITK